MSPVVGQFTSIRQQLADVLRDYHPDQPRDGRGRFASGGGGKQEKAAPPEHHHGFAWAQSPFHAAPNLNEHTMTPKQLALVLSKLNPDGATNICGGCGKITNGPHAGFVLGIQPTISGKHINDTYCPDCMYHHLFAGYRNLGRTDQNAHALSLWIMQHAFSPDAIRQLGVHVDDLLSAVPPPSEQKPIYKDEQRAQLLHRLAAQLSIIQMQAAQVMRGEEWVDAHGNVWIIERGAHGYFQGMYLVSAASGAGHVTLPSGAKAHVGVKGQVSVHEAARMLREKEGLREEHQPVKSLVDIKPVAELHNYKVDMFAPLDLSLLHQKYGDHQLAAALRVFPVDTLRQAATKDGIDLKGMGNNRDKIVTAIVAHVTRDEATGIPRYSGDFGKSGAAKSIGDFDARGLHRKLTPDETLQAADDYETFYKTHLDQDTGLKTSYGKPLAAFTDPNALWKYAHGDIERVYRLLRSEPGSNKLMLDYIRANPQFADVVDRFRRFASFPTAQELTEALDRHFNGDKASWGRNGTGKATPTEHPDLEPYRQALASLRERYANLMAARPDVAKAHAAAEKAASGGKGGKASGKTEDPLDTYIKPSSILVQPIKPVHGYNADPSKPHDAHFLYNVYGGRQFVTVLQTLTLSQLRDTAKLLENETGAKAPSKTRAETIRYIIEHTVTDEAGRKEVDDAIAALRQQGEPATPSSGTKTAGAGKTSSTIPDDGLVVKRPVAGKEISIVAPPDARFLRELYGHEQLAKALARYTPRKVREAAAELGISQRGSKADIIARILAALKDEPETIFSQMRENTPQEPTQRATLPTLAAIRATLRRIA